MTRRARIPTPEEDEAINRGIALDPDNPELTDADWAAMRPAREVMPELVEAYLRAKRGKQKKPTKVLVSLRLEREVVDKLRASGPGWQARANEMLRKAVLG
ncbi:MAG: BrnA antitoxin family protein [Acetobacteraceae bacterium]